MTGWINDVINKVHAVKMIIEDGDYNIPHSYLKLIRPSHPNNCLTLDLTLLKDVNIEKIQSIRFYFVTGTAVNIWMEDHLKSVKRTQNLNGFENSGPEMYLANQTTSIYKYFAVKL